MVRRFVTYDGEIKAEEEWNLKPTDTCFFCEEPLILTQFTACRESFDGQHDFVTLIKVA